MAITITPKYKPFTYDELVKPLEGYWKDYDKAEEDLESTKADILKLEPYLNTLEDLDGNKEYKAEVAKYKASLQSLVEDLTTNGLTAENKSKIKGLKGTFNNQISPIVSAIENRNKYVNGQLEAENAGTIFGIGAARGTTLKDFYGSNTPGEAYSTSFKEIDQLAGEITKNVTDHLQPQYKEELIDGLTEYNTVRSTKGISATDFINGSIQSNSAAGQIINNIRTRMMSSILANLGYTPEQYAELDTTQKNRIMSAVDNSILTNLQYKSSVSNYGKDSAKSKNPSSSSTGSGSKVHIAKGYLPTASEWNTTEEGKKWITKKQSEITAAEVSKGLSAPLAWGSVGQSDNSTDDPVNNSKYTPNYYRYTLRNHYTNEQWKAIVEGASDSKKDNDKEIYKKIIDEYAALNEGQSRTIYKTPGKGSYIKMLLPKLIKDKNEKIGIEKNKKGEVQYEVFDLYLPKTFKETAEVDMNVKELANIEINNKQE